MSIKPEVYDKRHLAHSTVHNETKSSSRKIKAQPSPWLSDRLYPVKRNATVIF
ncbi:MAG TPA: hypothetical protein V6D14_28395 [Coleofasciculaceae cyanobacterium]